METATISCVCWVPCGSSANEPRSSILEVRNIDEIKRDKNFTYFLERKRDGEKSKKNVNRNEKSNIEKPYGNERTDHMPRDESDGDIANLCENKDEKRSRFGEEDGNYDDKDDFYGNQLFSVFSSDSCNVLNEENLETGYDDSEEENAKIVSTDNVLIAGNADNDLSSIEIYVYDAVIEALYVHHDILTGGYPLCLEWLNLLGNSMKRNLVAFGSFDSHIQIFDLDVVDELEPIAVLGEVNLECLHASSSSFLRKKHTRINNRNQSGRSDAHEGPVMCLHRSPSKEQLLCSGSADETIRIWDLTCIKSLLTLQHHQDKVQSVRWHLTDDSIILSASFDRTASVTDIRQNKHVIKFPLSTDAECCYWNVHRSKEFMVSCEDGTISGFDIRKCPFSMESTEKNKTCLWSLIAHKGATTSMCMSDIPNMLMSCGMDGYARLWNTGDTKKPKLVSQKKLFAGPLYSCSPNPDNDRLFGFGGQCVVLWDIEHNVEAQNEFEFTAQLRK